ncbi:hypothetical protein [Thiocystis minor]|nr:hypothetical protein [Thiocystis minor]
MLKKLGQQIHAGRENPGRDDHIDYDNDNDTKVFANGLVEFINELLL